MIIGIPKEIKTEEYRVGIVPAGVKALVDEGHRVIFEAGAGLGSGIKDEEYKGAGAGIVPSARDIYSSADLIMKVKEPQPSEFNMLREGQILYTYLHLAAEPEVARALLEGKVKSVAYETIELSGGTLPLLKPMSEVAGRMSVQVGAYFLQENNGGRGVLLGGVPGVAPGKVTILGAGVVGLNALKIAVGMGAQVIILNRGTDKLAHIDELYKGRIVTLASNQHNIEEAVLDSDLVIGAVLLAGARAPRLVTKEMVSKMKKGSVIVDVSIDQGGCIETSKRTTHKDPVYKVDGVSHYCVANMPGAVPRTSSFALTNATLPYALKIAKLGLEEAARKDAALAKGINTYNGRLTNRPVAEALEIKYEALNW
ncbi:MAG: alanine dehydrogenase [Deltaproteobacteria bacterium]|nr:alanine dehydrogenase [Deltaproteobacteria bacterium]